MANRRMIYQDFFEDEYFGAKEYGLRLLWIGLIVSAADDQGRILDNTSLIRAKAFMFDSIENDKIDKWLSILVDDGKVIRYKSEGKSLIQITNWWEYQTPSWASPSKYPPPDNWTDRIKYHATGGKIEMQNWDQDGGLHNPLHSPLPMPVDSSLNDDDIKDDIKSDIDDYDDTPQPLPDDLFHACRVIYETTKGYPVTDGQSFTLMIKEFEKEGVTAQDYREAIKAMDADPKYSGRKPTSYKNWAIGYAQERRNPKKKPGGKQPKKAISPEDYKKSWLGDRVETEAI